MKLYQYDHCPFCVRVDMVANYKAVPHEKVYLLNDDEKTCHRLIGAKLVPILEFDDGQAMGESLDIVARLDQLGNERPLRPQAVVDAHLRELAAVDLAINCLLFPRNIAIGLPEFATAGARAYFRDKKEGMIRRTFEKALAETAQHRTAVEVALAALPELPLPSRHADTLGLDDVLLYPTLRNLTMVKGLAFPPEVRRYIDEVTALADGHTYFDRAC